MAWIAKLPIVMRKSHYLIRKDKLHEMLLHGWLIIPPSVINAPLDQHNLELISQSRSQIPGPEMEYTNLAISWLLLDSGPGSLDLTFWGSIEVLKVVLKIFKSRPSNCRRGPQKRHRIPEVAIEALKILIEVLKSPSRSSKSEIDVLKSPSGPSTRRRGPQNRHRGVDREAYNTSASSLSLQRPLALCPLSRLLLHSFACVHMVFLDARMVLVFSRVSIASSTCGLT
jgi:hypothetical protein